jgi:hypothetical protein
VPLKNFSKKAKEIAVITDGGLCFGCKMLPSHFVTLQIAVKIIESFLVNRYSPQSVVVFARVFCFLVLILAANSSSAVSLEDLRGDAQLTPQRFFQYFSDFSFKLGDKQQPHSDFLAKRCGDCDDFATLAADVLTEKGYTTHIIVVSMDAGIHVVCYVAQEKAYLDYNNRVSRTLVASDGSLADVAGKVAASFHSVWRTASEFQIANGTRRCLRTELH